MYSVYEMSFDLNGKSYAETVTVEDFGEVREIAIRLMKKGCKNIVATFLYDDDEYWGNYDII